MKSLRTVVSGLAMVFSLCCFSSGIAQNSSQNEYYNLTLFIDNQDFVQSVDIKVYIDEKEYVNEEFPVDKGSFIAASPQEFNFPLAKGKHQLRVESTKAVTGLQSEFEITEGENFVTLFFLKKSFNFEFFKQRPGFC
jgi:hypothetical protein